MKDSNAQADRLASKPPKVVEDDTPDFAMSHHGTVSLFHPLTISADSWLQRHCPPESEHQYFGPALAIEHRFVEDIFQRACDDGLVPATSKRGRN